MKNLTIKEKDEIYNKLHDFIKSDLIEYSYRFSEDNDIVIGPPHVFELACLAEKFNTPYISVNYNLQIYRTNDEAPFKFSDVKDIPFDKLWDIYESLYNVSLKRIINRFRKEHEMPPAKNVFHEVVISDFLNLIPYSKHLYKAKRDWNQTYQMCGFMKSPNDYNNWEPPEALFEFMEGEEKPVFISVGSMAEHEIDLENFQSLLLKAAHLISRKVIILTNWKEGNVIEDNVYKLKGFISYPVILKKCALVVHHGGVGTSHNTTEAGCPSIVIKYGHDQHFNAKVLFDAGISNGSIDRKDLNAEELARLINDALENKQMKKKAEELALLLQNENGVEIAIEIIEQKINHPEFKALKIENPVLQANEDLAETHSQTITQKI